MNRRILLIDADSAFHTTVAKQLARFRFDIVHELDAERGHTAATAQPPALMILAVEEPEKAGFKVFQKLRKGATAKVPIMLVTSTMTPESFLKHKALKVHADEYLDKRTQADELLGKLEQLIGLGDPIEDDADIPIEVDEIPLAEGDMVLEETIGEDDIHEFDDAHNMGTRNMQVDQLVDAEIDAGFAAMFGDEPVEAPAPAAVAAPAPAPAPEGDEASKVRAPIDVANESVPVPIQDGGRREEEVDDDAFDSFEEEPARPISASRAPIAIDDDLPINSRDMIPIEELAAAADAEDRSESTQVQSLPPEKAAPVVETEAEREFSQHDMVTRAAPVNPRLLEELSIPIAVAHVNRATGDTMAPAMGQVPAPDMAAIDPPTAPPSVLAARELARSKRDSMQPIVDLGLDEVAVRAESEQSGVHDRRSLQKVGELERQIAQLKTELERAKAASAGAGTSRANDFVNLREQITARDKELLRAREDLAAREREVTEAQDKARQALAARTTLESRAHELDQLRTQDLTRIAALEGREKTLGDQIAALKKEVDARAAAVVAADQTRLQIERDLAAERARAAAGASDAERSLRVEREQLIARHQGELAGARAEAEKLREAALASLRAELEADAQKATAAAVEAARKVALAAADQAKAELAQAHAAELDGLRQQFGDELAALEREHGEAVAKAGAGTEALTREHAEELERVRADHAAAIATHQDAVAKLTATHEDAVAKLAAEHAQRLADHREEQAIIATRARAAHDAELARLREEHEAALAAAARAVADATAGTDAELARLRAEHDKALAAKVHAHGAELDKVRAAHTADLDKVRAEGDQAISAKAAAHAAELEQLRAAVETARRDAQQALADQATQHAGEVAQRTAALDETTAALAQHAAALDAAKTELDRQAAAHESRFEDQRREHEAALAKHEAGQAELVAGHRKATDALAAAHAAQLAQATDALAAAHAEELAKLERDAAAELARQREAAEREASESRAALVAAKRTAEEAARSHQAERDAHDKALAELKGQHERALAMANGDFLKQKSVSDADHVKALAAVRDEAAKQRAELEATHAATATEVQRERDELQQGLSSAREHSKRLDGELASAVQTIADRNAELRGHLAAIAERDQRIAELRKEIDSLEAENASYQEQVLRAYQKIKTDEAMVARAKKAMAIALTVLDDQGNPS